ncbi:MAG: hypothetical protein J7641_05510 [Cyanobacteria bacterium SID2]|nr:hypothetical protein [Cyanobacteria bacterium SID2]
MTALDIFTKLCAEIEQQSPESIDRAVNCWLQKLRLPVEPNEVRNHINLLCRHQPVQTMLNRVVQESQRSNMKSIVLFSFLLVGAGLVLYYLKRANQANNDRSWSTSGRTTSQQYILFLVLDADGSQATIERLRRNEPIKSSSIETLSSTSIVEGIWQGTESEFQNLRLAEVLPEFQDYQGESPFDVYLVQIELQEPEPEFKKGSNSMDRYTAFRRLLGKPHKILEISNRLPREAYKKTHLYR